MGGHHDSAHTLPRVLGPTEALCVIVGNVIGSGIFLVPATIALKVPYIGGIALVWIIGGFFSAAGALTLAELGGMLPSAGGPYVYLRAAYGPLWGFLFGWTEFLVVRTGSMATLAAAFARYFSRVVPAPEWVGAVVWQAMAATAAIAIVGVINVLGTKLGGRVQAVGTALKVGALCTMILLPFALGQASTSNLKPLGPPALDPSLFAGFMAAMISVLWAYDGWVNVSQIAEEVRDPGRNVPRALILGSLILIALYLSMTLVYHMVLPLNEIQAADTVKGSENAVAADFCRQLMGPPGVIAISLVVMCSTFISLNGNALTGPRVSFAMARDGLFPRAIARVHPQFQTPAISIITLVVWAILLTIAGTALILLPPPASAQGMPRWVHSAWVELNKTPLYDVLYTYVIFGATIFYTLAIASVFVLRRKMPGLHRPYRTFGYPFTPLVFVVAALILMGNMLMTKPFESGSGLLIIAAGLPAYWFFKARSRKAQGV